MKPDNRFTSPEQRFFFPDNGQARHHESLDTSNLPGTVHIPGNDHYVVVRDESGAQRGHELSRGLDLYTLRPGMVIEDVRTLNPGGYSSRYINEDQIDRLSDPVYRPQPGTLAILVDEDRDSVTLWPVGEPLPAQRENEDPDNDPTMYKLDGFIDANDRLIHWRGENSYNTALVDWCVANALVQNSLEEALLEHALPFERHLVGMVQVNTAAKAYLEYYDRKHQTHFTPSNDPRRVEPRFAPLVGDQRELFFSLTAAARNFREYTSG